MSDSRTKQRLGRQGEDQAAAFLHRSGYRLLQRNFRTRRGEIDIIAEEGETLVFVEVKTRRSRTFGSPAAAVTCRKQQQMVRVAMEFLASRGIGDRPVRFDVVTVWWGSAGPELEIIKDAFSC